MKSALVIGNARYSDRILARLHTPDADVRALAAVLLDGEIGAFDEVTPVIDQARREVGIAIEKFLRARKRDDLALLYFSGHGVLDNHGQLFLATADTEAEAPSATAIPASFVIKHMDDCRARQQVLILDCCHSGAFAEGTAKGGDEKVLTEASFKSESRGSGRVVLAASDSMQSSWEGDRIIQHTQLSLFTHFLLEGLKTGKADVHNRGEITLNELYEYAYEQVICRTPKQAPQIWAYRQQGEIVIARNPHAKQEAVTAAAPTTTTTAKPRQEDAEVIEALKNGQLILAVKTYRRLHDCDVGTASKAVHAIRDRLDSRKPVATATTTAKRPQEDAEVIEALKNGQRIEAIRMYRELHDCNMQTAQKAVQAISDKLDRTTKHPDGQGTGSKPKLTQDQIKKVFEKTMPPVCGACGQMITTLLQARYYVCRTCGRKFHDKLTCVEVKWKSTLPAGRAPSLHSLVPAGDEYYCKFCHTPLELVRDTGRGY